MKFISAAFHPLLMASYTSIILYYLYPSIYNPIPGDYIRYFIAAIFITTFVIPAISILFLKATKRISSLELTNREERILPFVFIIAFYAMSTYMFHSKLGISSSVTAMMLLSTALIVVLSLVSIRFKVSIHAAAIWGMCAILTVVVLKYLSTNQLLALCICYILAGITSTSRLYLNQHTALEVWVGTFIGFALCLLGGFFFV